MPTQGEGSGYYLLLYSLIDDFIFLVVCVL